MTGGSETGPAFTPRQGRCLSFLHDDTRLNRVPPAEADFVRCFAVGAPTLHPMLRRLQADGWIDCTPGQGRSVRLRVARDPLPDLE